jgi:hypothetical protein
LQAKDENKKQNEMSVEKMRPHFQKAKWPQTGNSSHSFQGILNALNFVDEKKIIMHKEISIDV